MVKDYETMARLSYVDRDTNPPYSLSYPERTPNPVCVECGKACVTEEDKTAHAVRRLCEEHSEEYQAYLRRTFTRW